MELVLMSGIPSVHDIVHLESCLGFFFAYCRHKQMKQQRHLSLMALELLIDITPFAAGNAIFRNATRPTCYGELCHRFRHECCVATITDESLHSMAVVGGFLHGLGPWLDVYEVRAFHFRKMCEAAGT